MKINKNLNFNQKVNHTFDDDSNQNNSFSNIFILKDKFLNSDSLHKKFTQAHINNIFLLFFIIRTDSQSKKKKKLRIVCFTNLNLTFKLRTFTDTMKSLKTE